MKKSITSNFIYNTAYQIIAIILPIITTPYLSRILGAENIGTYAYTISISAYFIMFGSLGIALYGQREIAYYQDEKTKYTKAFWEIIILRLITMTFSLIAFYFVFVFRTNNYQVYFKILLLEIIANAIDISWFFQGLEEFKKIVFRNLIVKLISIISIFVFVRTADDLSKYVIIYALSLLIGNLSLWLCLPKIISKINFRKLNIVKHLKQTLVLFIPQVAIQVYTILDKTMLGIIISDKSEVGYYEQAQKVVKIMLIIVGSLGTVMMPRIANSFAKKDKKAIEKYVSNSLKATMMLALPIVFGICVIAQDFVPIFFGKGYDKVTVLIQIISPIILMIGLSGNIGTQYLLATKQQGKYTISVCLGAVINFCLNMLLIPNFQSVGASIATIIAETSVTVCQIIMTKKQLKYKETFKVLPKYLFFAALMFGFCWLTNFMEIDTKIRLIIKVIIGTITYGGMLIISKDSLIMTIKDKIKMKIKSR